LAQNWFDSAIACQQQGGFLATISSQKENVLVFQFLASVGYEDSVWIGLNDIVVLVEYHWIDKSASSFRYWYSGQPDNYGGNQRCTRIMPSMYSRYWDDFYCELKLAALCKFNETAKLTTNEGNCQAIVKMK
jgi:KRAB domain-containing zinc finger protein